MAEKFRKDYKFPDFEIKTVELTFQIFNGHTEVHSLLFVVVLVRFIQIYILRKMNSRFVFRYWRNCT